MPQDTLDASSFAPDICSFITLLHAHHVKYMVVGGEAAIFFGYARLTGDVDFFYDGGEENTRKLYAALDAFWEGVIPGISAPEELMQEELIVQFGRPPNRIDLINSIDGIEFDDAWSDKITVELSVASGSIPLYYISLDHLIENKRATARPKDLADVDFLTKARQQRKLEP